MGEWIREFLLNDGVYCVWGIGLLELILTCILLGDASKKQETAVWCMALVTMGICYDAVIIGFGGMILPPLVPLLSRLRYLGHGLLIPLNLVICAYTVPFFPAARKVTWGLTVILMVLGGLSGWFRELDKTEIADMVRYVSVSPKDSWMERVNTALSFGTVIPVILSGIAVWVKQKTPSIFLAGLLMFVFSALGPATGNTDLIFLISMFGELLMVFFFTVYEKKQMW